MDPRFSCLDLRFDIRVSVEVSKLEGAQEKGKLEGVQGEMYVLRTTNITIMSYSLLRFLGFLGYMLYNSVITRFLTLVLIRCTFFHFFFNHRPQRVTYALSKVFHKFIAETDIEVKRSKCQSHLLTRSKEFSTQKPAILEDFLPCH